MTSNAIHSHTSGSKDRCCGREPEFCQGCPGVMRQLSLPFDVCMPKGPGGPVEFTHGPEATKRHFELETTQRARAVLTTDSAARKSQPVVTGVLDYFPDAIADVARLSKDSNDKHNPGEPMHWSREKSNDHADCIGRHMIDRGVVDDDGFLHDAKVAWRALAQHQLAIEDLRKQGVSYP